MQFCSQDFVPRQDQTDIAKNDWDKFRPMQRRVLLELCLPAEVLDDLLIHDTIEYLVFRSFFELSPDMQKSVTFMIGGL